jgi:hypothetical protein
MTSILKVNQIQTTAGAVPTAADLGLNVTGSVLQVVSTSTTGSGSTTSSSYVSTGKSLSITPTSASNKVMVIFSGVAQNDSSTGGMKVSVYRDGSQIYDPTLQQFSSSGGNSLCSFCVQYLDTPATTSSVTYTQYFAQYNAGTAYASNLQITLMEIAG